MKKLIIILLLSLFFQFNTHAFNVEWFTIFEESDNGYNFECEKFCLYELDTISFNDVIILSWEVKWVWNIWYWVIQWTEIVSLGNININENSTLDKTFILNEQPLFSRIPKDKKLYIYIAWNLKANNFIFKWGSTSIASKFIAWLKSNEGFTPYSINLRYWTKLNWIPIVQILYIWFVIILVILFIISKGKKKNILYLIIVLFLIISFKNLFDNTRTYVQTDINNFHNLGDYYKFTNIVRKEMNLDNKEYMTDINQCKYYSECISEWPFCQYWSLTLLRPCERTSDIEKSNYILLYKTEISKDLKNKAILYDENNNYLLKN
jgi:hypothetical protein